jgi:hypothetical protein
MNFNTFSLLFIPNEQIKQVVCPLILFEYIFNLTILHGFFLKLSTMNHELWTMNYGL